MATEKPPASVQVQVVPSAVATASAGGVPASNSLDALAASFLASGSAVPAGQLLPGRPASWVVLPSFGKRSLRQSCRLRLVYSAKQCDSTGSGALHSTWFSP